MWSGDPLPLAPHFDGIETRIEISDVARFLDATGLHFVRKRFSPILEDFQAKWSPGPGSGP
jgi:hypothetical protein